MTLMKSSGVWKPRWNVTIEGAGFTDVNFTPEEVVKLEAFITTHEGTVSERKDRWNEVGKRKREKEQQL